jgi:hypothetical protein
MLRRRMGRPGLIGTMARTAVVAGTATAVAGGVQRRQQARADDAAGQEQMEADAAAYQAQQSAPPPPPAPAEDDLLTQLARLGQMNQAGLIDDDEFAAAKAKLLGI